MSLFPYPNMDPIEDPTFPLTADYSAMDAIDPYAVMTFTPPGPEPATPPFTYAGKIWQIFFPEWMFNQRLIANIRHNDPSYPDGYWIDYTTAPNAEILERPIAGRTIPVPAPGPDWVYDYASSPYSGMSIENPAPSTIDTSLVLVGILEDWNTYYSFENPFWPDHYFEFLTGDYHPNKWPIKAYYVRWRLARSNAMWYWAHYEALLKKGSGIMTSIVGLFLLSCLFFVAPPDLPTKRKKHG